MLMNDASSFGVSDKMAKSGSQGREKADLVCQSGEIRLGILALLSTTGRSPNVDSQELGTALGLVAGLLVDTEMQQK